jgi:hypothetical protein
MSDKNHVKKSSRHVVFQICLAVAMMMVFFENGQVDDIEFRFHFYCVLRNWKQENE